MLKTHQQLELENSKLNKSLTGLHGKMNVCRMCRSGTRASASSLVLFELVASVDPILVPTLG